VVSIDVRRHEGVSRTLRVPADGNIRLPRLKSAIPARGKTCAELADLVTERLQSEGKLVLRPGQVSVNVSEMRVRRIYVRGNAGKNGDFDLRPGWRVTELVAVIGGVPNPDRVTARLYNPARPAPVKVNMLSALDDPTSPDNVMLVEGDTLTIELPRAKRFYVKGEGPRGVYELDERFGLRQALVQIGFTPANSGGDLKHAILIRRATPGDPNSEEVRTPVDIYALMSDPKTPEIALQDLDTLEIPVSLRFVYVFGETSVPRKFLLPEDRPTFLMDVMSMGGTTGRAKIDDIKIWRGEGQERKQMTFKFGKYLANGDPKQNPEVYPGDVIFVPDVKRADPVNTIWTAWGLYGIMQTLIPGIRP
jgi:protein involved in polysaccharide export with SLBB domain